MIKRILFPAIVAALTFFACSGSGSDDHDTTPSSSSNPSSSSDELSSSSFDTSSSSVEDPSSSSLTEDPSSSSENNNGSSSSVEPPKCGEDEYNSETHFCQVGTIKDLCGSKTYTVEQFCQEGTNAVLPLCDGEEYSEEEFCLDGTIKDLCGTETYTAEQMCHYGKVKYYFIDERDDKKYPYVEIGNQTWMAANLNWTNNDNSGNFYRCIASTTTAAQNPDNPNCEIYGSLYLRTTANTTEDFCPNGWHLPDQDEWDELFNIVAGGMEGASQFLKAKCYNLYGDECDGYGWGSGSVVTVPSSFYNNLDTYGFAALPSGQLGSIGNASQTGTHSYWIVSGNNASIMIVHNTDDVTTDTGGNTNNRHSVRCVKDD